MLTEFRVTDRIQLDYGQVLLDTALLPNGRFETMLFPIKHGVVDYGKELDAMISSSEEAALAAHKTMREKWTKPRS